MAKLPIFGITYGPLAHEAEKMNISIGPLVCESQGNSQEYDIKEHVEALDARINDTITKIDAEQRDLKGRVY